MLFTIIDDCECILLLASACLARGRRCIFVFLAWVVVTHLSSMRILLSSLRLPFLSFCHLDLVCKEAYSIVRLHVETRLNLMVKLLGKICTLQDQQLSSYIERL